MCQFTCRKFPPQGWNEPVKGFSCVLSNSMHATNVFFASFLFGFQINAVIIWSRPLTSISCKEVLWVYIKSEVLTVIKYNETCFMLDIVSCLRHISYTWCSEFGSIPICRWLIAIILRNSYCFLFCNGWNLTQDLWNSWSIMYIKYTSDSECDHCTISIMKVILRFGVHVFFTCVLYNFTYISLTLMFVYFQCKSYNMQIGRHDLTIVHLLCAKNA